MEKEFQIRSDPFLGLEPNPVIHEVRIRDLVFFLGGRIRIISCRICYSSVKILNVQSVAYGYIV